jgi:hypothetical protein
MNEKGEIIEASDTIYNIRQDTFSLAPNPEDDDGVFEPGETIVFTEAEFHNTGSLTSPSNVCFAVVETPVLQSSGSMTLTPIAPQKSMTLSISSIQAKIHPRAIPAGQRQTKITVTSQCSIDGKLFPDSIVSTELLIQYPISMNVISPPTKMGRTEALPLTIELKNVSNVAYGAPTTNMKGGRVHVRFILEGSLLVQETYSTTVERTTDYIPAQSSTSISVLILMGLESDFYDKHKWTIELYLRNQLIDKQSGMIQVVPSFNPNMIEEDALFILCSSPTSHSFGSFRKIFDTLGLYNVNYWDAERYRGVSIDSRTNAQHEQTWVDRYCGKLIIIYAERFSQVLEQVSAIDIMSHFKNQEASGMLLITQDMNSISSEMDDYLLCNGGGTFDEHFKVKDVNDYEFVDWFRFGTPNSSTMVKKCQDIETHFEKQDVEHRYRIIVESEDVAQIARSYLSFQWVYTYGTASIYRVPLSVNQNLTGFELKEVIKVNDATIGLPTSPVCRLLYAIVYNLSIEQRLKMIHNDTMTKIVAESLYQTIYREFYHTTQDGFFRLEKILTVCDRYTESKNVINQVLMILYRLENDSYWSSWINSSVSEKRNKLIDYRQRLEDDVRTTAMSYDAKKLVARATLNYKSSILKMDTKILNYL